MTLEQARRGTERVAGWTQDPARVKRDILDVARQEFTEKGLSGARVDEIAARTATSKRMIYYYFGNKAQLYLAVLEEAYAGMRAAEIALQLDNIAPVEAMKRLVGVTFDHHAQNSYFVRLVMIENIHHGRHLKQSEAIERLNLSAIATVRSIYQRGLAAGVFRAGVDPFQLHLTISALAFYNVSNRSSIQEVFHHDMGAPESLEKRRAVVIDTVLRAVMA